jgi:hypothetical protein
MILSSGSGGLPGRWRSATLASQAASSLMPLWMSSRCGGCGVIRASDEVVDLAGCVTL